MKNKIKNLFVNKFLTTKLTFGSLISFLGFMMLYWSSNLVGNWGKFFIIIAGLLCLLMIFATIVRYLYNVYYQILSDKLETGRREFIFSISTLIGLIIPTALANYLIYAIFYLLGSISKNPSFLCEIRCTIVKQYNNLNVYNNVNTLLAFLVILNVLVFFVGVLRYNSNK